MKTVEVVAAIIVREGKVFSTRRGYGKWQGWWEFPGGKIEVGESPEEALVREIMEELDAEIEVGELLETVEWDSGFSSDDALLPVLASVGFYASE